MKDDEQAVRLLDELADRYGPLPDELRNLVSFALLKSVAERIGVESVDRRQGFANIKFHQQSRVNPMKLMDLVRNTETAQFTPAGVLKLPLRSDLGSAKLISTLRHAIAQLTEEEPALVRT